MESIVLIGAYSAADVLAKMMTSCACFQSGSSGYFWGEKASVEMDNSSVVPVCDDSSLSLDSSPIQRNVHFSQISNINALHNVTISNSTSTESTRSSFSIDDYEIARYHYYIFTSSLTKTSSDEEFIEVKLGTCSNHAKPSLRRMNYLKQRQSRQRQQSNNRQAQRHRFLGHTKRKQRVQKLLAEDVAHRQRKSEKKIDQD